MSGYEKELHTLLEITEEIYNQALTVHPNMEENEPEKLETVQSLFERRQEVIDQLDAAYADNQISNGRQPTMNKSRNYKTMNKNYNRY